MSSTNYPIQTLQHLTLRPRYLPQHPTPDKHQKKNERYKTQFCSKFTESSKESGKKT